jgi:hypothetical protein
MEWGLTRFAVSAGDCARASNALRSITVWIPNRVIGRPQRLRKRDRDGSPPVMMVASSETVADHSGQKRCFPPFPLILTLAAFRSRSATFSLVPSEEWWKLKVA